MFNTLSVSVPSVTLVNQSAVTIADIDASIERAILKNGALHTMQAFAKDAALVSDCLYRIALHVGAAQGVFSLPCNDSGKYPSGDEAVKKILEMVSTDSGNSQRKQVSKILNYAWKVTANGLDPFALPSVSALEKASKPAKEIGVKTDADTINLSEISAKEAAIIREESEAKAVQIEAIKAAEIEAAKAAEIEEKAELKTLEIKAAAKAELENEKAVFLADMQAALYGTKSERDYLKTKYVKAA